jgi:hypothetical protein
MTLLKAHPYHLSEIKARKRVVEILESVGITEPPEGWYRASVKIDKGEPTSILELVKEMRETGAIKEIQRILDHADPVFGGTLSLATTSQALALSIKHGSYEIKVPGPGLIMPIDTLIAEDILYFRMRACEHSNEPDFEITSRYFSSYIFFCVAMIEHFMHRYLSSALQDQKSKNAAEAILNYRGRFEDRMDQWLWLFTGYNLSHISNRAEWGLFIKVKNVRNKLIHGVEPYFAFSVKDMAEYLNCVQLGVGGLMKLIRDLQTQPSLLFIERLRTAPTIKYVPR